MISRKQVRFLVGRRDGIDVFPIYRLKLSVNAVYRLMYFAVKEACIFLVEPNILR